MAVEAPARQLTDFLRSLRAVREFQPKPVPDEVVGDILDVARWVEMPGGRCRRFVLKRPHDVR